MRGERRKDVRVEWNSKALIFNERGGEARPCIVSNLSNTGARIVLSGAESLSENCKLRITERSPLRNCIVVWRADGAVGVRFRDVSVPVQPLRRQDREWIRGLQYSGRRRAY